MTNKINDLWWLTAGNRNKTRESGHRFVVFSFFYPRSFESKERYIIIINKYKKFNLVIDINYGARIMCLILRS